MSVCDASHSTQFGKELRMAADEIVVIGSVSEVGFKEEVCF